ncbi:hypothetical protein [Metabacillus hrfriensis]|uniref:Uncharacterized protein n=1 Tax=Metabacillus hrfriensis TaxID=3048891 RepID=A0ACD4R7G1_9BACI|nr:hypothetical protein [Metabacillus sp. CT-WN-B3]WHZ56072.1 hypothetical protein QLQ22_15305 [Metabacillus sp. CT-WN-B3]
MRIESARAAAIEWVMEHASREAWFKGAYFSGSTIELPGEAMLPDSSDLDVMIITTLTEPPLKLGKFVYKGTLLEVTYLSWYQFTSVEEVLTSYHLANSFRVNTIIADPTGEVSRLQKRVSRHFADRAWVRRRCENALNRVMNGLRAVDTSAPFQDQVMGWLFPTGVTTHVLLVAALRNPTVRLRYLAAREVLIEYGQASLYPDLLKLLGCAHLTKQRIEHHLDNLARTFDATVEVANTPFFFSTDITNIARPIAIDGSRELIRSGYHREAVFWIVATYARCHTVLAADTSQDLQRALAPAFEEIVSDLGITSSTDLIRRSKDVIDFLPRLCETTEAILWANPDIEA